MEIEKLNRISEFASNMGFKTDVLQEDKAYFSIRKPIFALEVGYLRNPVNPRNEVYVMSSSVNTYDLDAIREFSLYLTKALILADKIKEVKNTLTQSKCAGCRENDCGACYDRDMLNEGKSSGK